jgi:hypothetical protein
MKTYLRLLSHAALGGVILGGFQGAAWSASRTLALNPKSTLALFGDSSLHPFTASASSMAVTLEVDAAKTSAAVTDADFAKAVLQPGALQRLELVIPVGMLKSKEALLDKNMRKAMKAERHPNIIFRLSSYEVTASTLSPSASHIKALGTLEISGRQNPVEVHMEGVPTAAGIRVQGDHSLMMSDYGIKPPTMMMGAIKVKDPVVIRFDLTLDPVPL